MFCQPGEHTPVRVSGVPEFCAKFCIRLFLSDICRDSAGAEINQAGQKKKPPSGGGLERGKSGNVLLQKRGRILIQEGMAIGMGLQD